MTAINQDHIKSAVLDVLKEHPELIAEALKEYIGSQERPNETKEERRERMRKLIQTDFDQFDDVFKALA